MIIGRLIVLVTVASFLILFLNVAVNSKQSSTRCAFNPFNQGYTLIAVPTERPPSAKPVEVWLRH